MHHHLPYHLILTSVQNENAQYFDFTTVMEKEHN